MNPPRRKACHLDLCEFRFLLSQKEMWPVTTPFIVDRKIHLIFLLILTEYSEVTSEITHAMKITHKQWEMKLIVAKPFMPISW